MVRWRRPGCKTGHYAKDTVMASCVVCACGVNETFSFSDHCVSVPLYVLGQFHDRCLEKGSLHLVKVR